MRLYLPTAGKKYLEIGDNCLIGGNFVFDSKDGHVTVGDGTFIGGSTFISHTSIEIGNHVTIAWGCTIYDHNSHSLDYRMRRKDVDDQLDDIRHNRCFVENKDWTCVKSKPIRICDDAWIGMNVIILKGVTVGEGAVVGAGSVVTKDVPPWTVVAGNPAKVVKEISH